MRPWTWPVRPRERRHRKISTTGRGIGPSYEDKIARRALRYRDLNFPRLCRQAARVAGPAQPRMTSFLGSPAVLSGPSPWTAKCRPSSRGHAPAELRPWWPTSRRAERGVEGGRQPAVRRRPGRPAGHRPRHVSLMSPPATAWPAAALVPAWAPGVALVLGITKAYCTRVGGGPVPDRAGMEVKGTPGYHMSTVGAEKGVTTGRARRCGWFDAALLEALRPGQWAVGSVHPPSSTCWKARRTRSSALAGELDGEVVDLLPMGADDIARCKAHLRDFAWLVGTHGGGDRV